MNFPRIAHVHPSRWEVALPYAGGTYQCASFGMGRPWGMLAGWNFIISLVALISLTM